jgi:hypothetical protein
MFRFLDIDLDAFVDPIAYRPPGGRLDENAYTCWPEARLRDFLERQCGLCTSNPIPGRFAVEHEEAFDVLACAYEAHGQIDLTHVDGHADLGMGDSSWLYMHTDLLQLPMPCRGTPTRGRTGMNSGSWVAFAAAAGWLAQVAFVFPDRASDDLPAMYLHNGNPATRLLEFKRYEKADVYAAEQHFRPLSEFTPVECDPAIPFEKLTLKNFVTTKPFKLGFICQSPDYTPESADALIPIIREYVRF